MFRFKVFDYLSGLSLEAPFHWPTVAFRINSNGSPFPFPMFCSSLNIDQMQSCMKVRNQPWKSIFVMWRPWCTNQCTIIHCELGMTDLGMTLQKYFSHPSFNYLLFCNSAHKTKIRTANRWETTNSKPPEPIIVIGQSKTWITSQIIFIALFFRRCTAVLRLLPASQQTEQICRS
jgi:hypothetical protein